MNLISMPGRLTSITSNPNPKLRAALSQVDGYDQTAAAIGGLKRQAPRIAPSLTVEQTTAEVYNEVWASGAIPADLLARYQVAQAAEAVYELAADQLNQVHSGLTATLDQLAETALSTICTTLNADLQRVYAELRKLRTIPRDASEAIAKGKTEQWQRNTELRAEYLQIRDAQRLIVAHGWRLESDIDALRKAWPMIGHAAGLGAVWTDLPEWHKHGQKKGKDGRLIRLTPPWPEVESLPGQPETEEFLDWLLKHPEAQPWVPSLDQAQQLLNEIVTAAKDVDKPVQDWRKPDLEAEQARALARRAAWGTPTHITGLDDNVGLRPEEHHL